MKTIKAIMDTTIPSMIIVWLCVFHLAWMGFRGTGTEKDYLLIIAALLIAFHVRPE